MDVVVCRRSRPERARLLVAVPLLAGSFAILVARLGLVAGLVTLALAVAGVMVALATGARWSARHQRPPEAETGVLLQAEAGLDGRAGILVVGPDMLRWLPRRPKAGVNEVAIRAETVTSVDLATVGPGWFRAARLVIHGRDGADMRLTVTAAPEAVRQALTAMS
jgi:hypothetical protein